MLYTFKHLHMYCFLPHKLANVEIMGSSEYNRAEYSRNIVKGIWYIPDIFSYIHHIVVIYQSCIHGYMDIWWRYIHWIYIHYISIISLLYSYHISWIYCIATIYPWIYAHISMIYPWFFIWEMLYIRDIPVIYLWIYGHISMDIYPLLLDIYWIYNGNIPWIYGHISIDIYPILLDI